ncbi:MAG TPA: CCA tRNA nucleotidyltransferase [Gemmatimonadaceae bacterium]|nr:CCA tRNA nucleotidyltransferase [Gemmatimonadaceae bacterium]
MPLMQPPETVVEITRVLEAAGYEAWCVGGGVRDALLGIPNLDWDLTTSARPLQVRKLFKRTVPVGIEFGTIGVLDEKNIMHEVTTFRSDVETDGRHAVVKFGESLEDDLARRDFTINAIAYSPSRDELRDPFGGQRDLAERVLRAVGIAKERMREDRLRALRAIRFASRFGFTVDTATWQAILVSAPHLGRLSPERVQQEIVKTMNQVALPSTAFRMWRDSGAFAELVPGLAGITDVELLALDHLRLPQLARRPQRLQLRLAGLFSAARPGTVHAMLKALRFSNADAAWVGGLVERWHEMGRGMKNELMRPEAPADSVLRSWAGHAGRTRLAPLLRIADAHWWAERERGRPAPSRERVESVYRRAIRIAYRDPVEVSDLAVNGDDLHAIGITGRQLGQTLRALLQYVLEDPSRNTPDMLLSRARGDA